MFAQEYARHLSFITRPLLSNTWHACVGTLSIGYMVAWACRTLGLRTHRYDSPCTWNGLILIKSRFPDADANRRGGSTPPRVHTVVWKKAKVGLPGAPAGAKNAMARKGNKALSLWPGWPGLSEWHNGDPRFILDVYCSDAIWTPTNKKKDKVSQMT